MDDSFDMTLLHTDKAWTELEASGGYPEAFMIRSAIQQFPVQGVYLQKLR